MLRETFLPHPERFSVSKEKSSDEEKEVDSFTSSFLLDDRNELKRDSRFSFFSAISESMCDIKHHFLFTTLPSLSAEASPNMAPKSSQKSIVEVNVDRGSKVHLPCNIQGNPLPIFTWYRLSDSGSYYSVPSSQRIIPSQTLLLIRNVDDRDAGRWVNVAFGEIFKRSQLGFIVLTVG